jgi:Flp pilus assembly protein TadG
VVGFVGVAMMNRIRIKNVGTARGQAMVEFLVAALFLLVPLFLALAVIGKTADVQHTTQMSARYAAWERTVWYQDAGSPFDNINGSNQKSATQIHNEIAQRLINDHSSSVTVIKDTDKNADKFGNGTDPMWRDNAGVVYMDDYAQLGASVNKETPSRDIADSALNLINKISIPSVTGTLAPPLPTDTLAVAEVNLGKIAKNSAAYQRLWPKDGVWVVDWMGLEFKATGAILSNTWNANGSGATHQMVAESVPTSKALGTAVNLAYYPGVLPFDPINARPNHLQMGKVAQDVVPGDRLK